MTETPVAGQLRRRRAASRRLPELPCGRHDPIDPPRQKTRAVTMRLIGSRLSTAEFDGPGVLDAFKRLDIVFMRSRYGGGWWCPARHAEDVMAYLEARGFRIEPTL